MVVHSNAEPKSSREGSEKQSDYSALLTNFTLELQSFVIYMHFFRKSFKVFFSQ